MEETWTLTALEFDVLLFQSPQNCSKFPELPGTQFNGLSEVRHPLLDQSTMTKDLGSSWSPLCSLEEQGMRSQRKHTEEGRREEKTQSNRHVLFSSVSVHSNFLVPPPHLLFNQPPSPTLCSTGEANFGCPVHTCLPPAPR